MHTYYDLGVGQLAMGDVEERDEIGWWRITGPGKHQSLST